MKSRASIAVQDQRKSFPLRPPLSTRLHEYFAALTKRSDRPFHDTRNARASMIHGHTQRFERGR